MLPCRLHSRDRERRGREGRRGRERGKDRKERKGGEKGKEGGTGPPPIKSWLRACVDITTAFRVHYDILPVRTVIDIHSIVMFCTLSLHQCWNRIFGSTILAGSGRVTGQ